MEQYITKFLFSQINAQDLSPNYAGTMWGFTNMLANVIGFIAPLVAGIITDGNVRAKRIH